MGQELWYIAEHTKKMKMLAQAILNHAEQIEQIQGEHPHVWTFSYQVNAQHERIWHVMYQCNGCGLIREEKKDPVCEECNISLVRCDKCDIEAETERLKPKHGGRMNPPLSFRCPSCRKVHVLWHIGD